MELLLIFAAMLSAVTGAFTGARGPEARLAHAQAASPAGAAVAIVEVATEKIATTIPANAALSLEVPALPGFVLAVAFPRYADRLIE
jgi:hypothetical protein